MPTTYEPIATTTLGSAAASITFSSIPATYTDLRLILVARGSSAGAATKLTFNNDTGSNYSYTMLYGDGTLAKSYRVTSQPYLLIDNQGFSTTNPHLYQHDFMSYSGSTKKTILSNLSEDDNGSGFVTNAVSLWNSTSAISTISIATSAGNFSIGTTATLYGIKNA